MTNACRPSSLRGRMFLLSGFGFNLRPGVTSDDLFAIRSREDLMAERGTCRKLVETMALDLPREPWTPIANQLWMCDLECIAKDGDYRAVVERLELMTRGRLRLTNIEDRVGADGGSDWVQFEHAGSTIRWELRACDRWLDPMLLSRYARLLVDSRSHLRLYGAFEAEYGQHALLVALPPKHREEFHRWTQIPMRRLD